MRWLLLAVLAAPSLVMALASAAQAGDDAKKPLQGVWLAQSMEADGKPAPAETVKQMRWTFRGDKLLIAGNSPNGKEAECPYKIDSTKSPKQLDFTPPMGNKEILGIYEVKGDELKICLRHASSADGRPTEFATKPGSSLVLMVLKKQKS